VHELNKLQEKKYHIVGTVPKSNKIIVEIDKVGTSNTHIHVRIPDLVQASHSEMAGLN